MQAATLYLRELGILHQVLYGHRDEFLAEGNSDEAPSFPLHGLHLQYQESRINKAENFLRSEEVCRHRDLNKKIYP